MADVIDAITRRQLAINRALNHTKLFKDATPETFLILAQVSTLTSAAYYSAGAPDAGQPNTNTNTNTGYKPTYADILKVVNKRYPQLRKKSAGYAAQQRPSTLNPCSETIPKPLNR